MAGCYSSHNNILSKDRYPAVDFNYAVGPNGLAVSILFFILYPIVSVTNLLLYLIKMHAARLPLFASLFFPFLNYYQFDLLAD